MTVTLTVEELDQFQTKLKDWYDRRSIHIMKGLANVSVGPIDAIGAFSSSRSSVVDKLAKDFEAQNPKPDWRTLL